MEANNIPVSALRAINLSVKVIKSSSALEEDALEKAIRSTSDVSKKKKKDFC